MPTVEVAQLTRTNQHMNVVFMSTSFGTRSRGEQEKTIRLLKLKATEAGLSGQLVPVWKDGATMKGIAPAEWQAFFKSIVWKDAVASATTTLSW
jgi:hypothetical protein